MACQFDRLSDCILLTLLEKLDGTSLYQLSRVNTRFQRLALETSFWRHIEARAAPNNEKKINYIIDRVHDSTDMLLLKGRSAYPRVIELIQLNIFSKLTILALENQIISDSTGIRIVDFPKSLVELSFKNSVFEASSEFFRKGFGAMENLKVLIVDGCSNVNCSVIMSVSKYPNLEIFSCYKCPIENSVAYFSIAVSSGFKKIKVFDVRLSGLGNTFLSSMLKKSGIVMLYFQNKDTSYELDFQNRAEEALSQNLPVPKVQFHSLPVTGNEENLVTDFGTLEFSRTSANFEECKVTTSFLYKYPYLPCTCGFRSRQEELPMRLDDAESTELTAIHRGDERNLVDIITEEECSDDEIIVKKENGDLEEYSEIGNNTGNFSTGTGQSSDSNGEPKRETSEDTITSSSSDVNSQLDATRRNPLLPSRTCTEIIYSVFSKKKKTKNKSVGTDTTNKPTSNAPDDDKMDTAPIVDSCNPQDQPNDSTTSNVNNTEDQPNDSVTSNVNNIEDQRNDGVSTSINNTDDQPNDSVTINVNNTKDQPSDSVTDNANNTKDQGNDTGISKVSNSADRPSTSGLSIPMRKRRVGLVNVKGGKRLKGSFPVDVSSSSSDDEGGKRVELDPSVCVNIPCSLKTAKGENNHERGHGNRGHNRRHSDGQILYISRGNTSSRRISNAVTTYLNDRSRRIAESNESSSNDQSTSRARRRDVALVECRAGSNAQPARTQVYPCACGNHSVIVVTADETDDGDVVLGPPLNPPENHFHPRHCEQRINLNSHQSLRVINRNANANARPEIELVEIKKDKSLKCALKQISFRGYHRITDLTLRNVGHLDLDLLDVTYTRCTKKGILDFLRLNPNCRVLHKDFCVCKPRLDF